MTTRRVTLRESLPQSGTTDGGPGDDFDAYGFLKEQGSFDKAVRAILGDRSLDLSRRIGRVERLARECSGLLGTADEDLLEARRGGLPRSPAALRKQATGKGLTLQEVREQYGSDSAVPPRGYRTLYEVYNGPWKVR